MKIKFALLPPGATFTVTNSETSIHFFFSRDGADTQAWNVDTSTKKITYTYRPDEDDISLARDPEEHERARLYNQDQFQGPLLIEPIAQFLINHLGEINESNCLNVTLAGQMSIVPADQPE
ncbi:MAG UNVERIFIED_CONTAM: hypothetical protein LVQ98_02290 [Rickettsiaceae bacterium]|jgi:hypothetical protein